MTMFGINIQIENIRKKTYIDEYVDTVLKRKDERKVFKQFLESKTSSGHIVFDEITKTARLKANELLQNDINIPSDALFGFTISSLKNIKSGKLNVYDSIVRKIIEEQCPKYKTLHQNIDSGKFKGSIPFGYPDASKRAQGVLNAKIKDSLPDVKTEYVMDKVTREIVAEYSREMFHGINKLGLRDLELVNYLGIIYDLNSIKQSPFLNNGLLKEMISKSLVENKNLNLLYVKCLRFAYPKTGGVNVIPDLEDTINEGRLGRVLLKSETGLKTKLDEIKAIFEFRNIPVKFTICVADEDLDILFPLDNPFVDSQGLNKAKENVHKYVESLNITFAGVYEITTTSHLSSKTGGTYLEFRSKVATDIKNNGGRYIDPNLFEKSRVDYQYLFYQRLLGKTFSRDYARKTAREQITSVIALQEILKLYKDGVILVEESRGDENKLIANGSVPVVFARLRDEAKFDVE